MAAATNETPAQDDSTHSQRLPTNVVPRHYDLTLEPDFEKLTFDGTVIINADVAEASTSITVNTLKLETHSAKVTLCGEKTDLSPRIEHDEAMQITRFNLQDALPAGAKIQLHITFTGILGDKMAGFYRSTFKKTDGSEGIIATTHMEPADARRAFPCFDEPSLKATFSITLIADQNLTCLSNMDVLSESQVSGTSKKTVRFNKSPVMSTYLVAFIIGEFNYIESLDFRVPCRVYASPDQDIEQGRHALDLCVKTLKFYEELFGIEYPLPKLDQVSVPDFAQGAMENWGLVIYRVTHLLLDDKNSSAAAREGVTSVVQHELSHQWFGNLVTMDWWEGLWLNEGFAEWVSWYSRNKFYPEWHVWQTYVVQNLRGALYVDSLRSSHPIEVPVHRASDIVQIFDGISYAKGSCVVRMISAYLGDDVFFEGVRAYLTKHAYGNANTGDLWDALAEKSGKPVRKMMATWTENIGYPFITVTEKDDQGTIHVKQNRFLSTADTTTEEDQVLWPVFLNVRTREGVDKSLILREREQELKLPDGDFFKLNADHTGIYRVLYSPERLGKLGQAAKAGLLTVEDRAGMIADAGALATSGHQRTSGVLNLLTQLDTESNFIVWSEMIRRIESIQAAWMFEDDSTKRGLEAFLRDLTSTMAHKMGWDVGANDDHVDQQFKTMLFQHAGLNGDKVIVDAAKEMFKRFVGGDSAAVHPGLRASVLAMAVKHGGEREYEQLVEYHANATGEEIKGDCLQALGRAEQPELIERTLQLIVSSDKIKPQDIFMPLLGLREHARGTEALFRCLTENFADLSERFPPELPMFGHIVMLMASSMATEAQLAELERFFADRDKAGYEQPLKQCEDTIRTRMAWTRRDRGDVASWLEAHGYMAGP